MNSNRIGLLLALAASLALATLPLMAQEPPPPPAAEHSDADARLKEAQARLEAAARDIAELTAELVGEAGIQAIEELARKPRRAVLGISIGPAGGEDAREDGVQVLGVTPAGPADEAGIRSGDVLLTIGDVELDWADGSPPSRKLLEALRGVEPGTEVRLGYRRNGTTGTTAVKTRSAPGPMGFAFGPEGLRIPTPPAVPDGPGAREFLRLLLVDRWGDMELVALTPGLAEYFETGEGVLVVRAPSDATLGLKDGDVIVDIAGRKPADPAHVARILRSYAPGERLVMTIIRHGKRMQLEADIPASAERG